MLSSTGSALLRLAGWSYLPDLATRKALGFFHHFLRIRRPQTPPPAPGTPAWQRHYRYTFAAVVLGFLLYNLLEASRSTPPNFYETLGVGPDADELALKTAFRAFARRNHPDRVGQQGEGLFIAVRDAFEALKNPTTRFAYDRFGPDAMRWSDCTTPKEFLHKGLLRASGFYIGSSLVLLFMSAALKPSPVAFWRYLLLIALFASELSLLLGPSSANTSSDLPSKPVSLSARLVTLVFPHRVAHQHILLLHQLFVFLSVALSRVVPVLFPQDAGSNADDARAYAPLFERIHAIARAADREVSRILQTELHAIHGPTPGSARFSETPLPPCTPTPQVIDALAKEMEAMIIEHQLQLESPVRSAWATALERRSADQSETILSGGVEVGDTRDIGERRVSEKKNIRTNGTLPSPSPSVSPIEHPKELSADDEPNGDVPTYGARLPSPRPSPPPISHSSRHPPYRDTSP